jgi:NAD-dependent dihydropyrimidine dehydrogenase PreA subunit
MGKPLKGIEVFLVYVDPERCDGCKECLWFCSFNVFDFTTKAIPVRPENCLGCRTCEAVCKSKAVIITEI